jgi:nitrite reductase (NADH) large subunit
MIQARRPTLVVVGTGMAGARVVEDVLARAPQQFNLRMFGDEPNGTYNRILLSGVLGGFTDPNLLWTNPLEWYEQRGVCVHSGVRAEGLNRNQRLVHGANGKVEEPYDFVVLATGSRPFVPPLEGADQQGVFVFRTLEHCGQIAAYARECDRVAVIGGGLLGLEAARGLLCHDLEVTVVEAAAHLMPQQLDAVGGELLKRKLEAMGVRVLLNAATTQLMGDGRVCGLRFRDGSSLDADMVVISCGIRPNVDEAKAAGLTVERGIVVDDQLRTNDSAVFAVGECAQHRGMVYGLVDPIWEQTRVLADVITGIDPQAAYRGSRLATTLKVMGVELTAMGDVNANGPDCEVLTHMDPSAGVYKKVVLRECRLVGAILLGTPDPAGRLRRLFKNGETITGPAFDLLANANGRDALLEQGGGEELAALPGDATICNCHEVSKATIAAAIGGGSQTVASIGECTRAGTGCGACQPLLTGLIKLLRPSKGKGSEVNKIEVMKSQKDGLDALDDVLRLAPNNNWQEMSEDDKQRAKWHGLFFRKTTPGHFMLRVRFNAGQGNSKQFRVLADLTDEYGKGFCDLTTRQQIQLRWFTLADLPDIWRRLDAVGLHSKQTGMDNVRGIIGCPLGGLTPHELLDASPVIDEFNTILLGNKEFTNLPRKFNVTITGCLENCVHAETQDIGLVPAYRELEGMQVNGFNVLVGGKQGSGGYRPATPLDAFVPPDEAARLCAEITRLFRDHGSRETRNRARLAFLIEDRGIAWFRAELTRRWGKPLHKAGTDLRKKHHTDHLGIHPQKPPGVEDPCIQLHSVGLLVPVGRITSAQMRGVADLSEAYGDGQLRLTVQQNVVIANVPESRIGAITMEPLLQELRHDPSPVMRGLVTCTGIDFCHLALIDTKGWALEVARDLEEKTQGHKIQPLSIHWSGCSAGCGLHQAATIGLQGCRSRVHGRVVDAVHVCAKGKTGPNPEVAADLMWDVPCDNLADALLPLVKHLPRK